MRPPTRTAKPARPARRGRARASVSRPIRLPLPFLALCGLLLLLFALAEFIRPPAAPPQRATVAQAAKPADGAAAPSSTLNLNLNGDVSGGNIALHALVGAVAAGAGGGDALGGAIGAGASEAARGIDITGKLFGIDPDKALRELEAQVDDGKLDPKSAEYKAAYEAAVTEYQQLKSLEKAINQGASLLVGGAASGLAGSDAMTGAGAAWSGEQFNRQLHDGKAGTKDEIGKLKEEAALLAENPAMQAEYGIYGTEEEILNKLKLAAFEMVKYGNEMESDLLLHAAAGEMQSIGKGLVAEKAFWEKFKSEGFFLYGDEGAEVDKYATTGRFSDKYYETVGYDQYGRPIETLTAEGLKLEAAYRKEVEGDFYNLDKGLGTAKSAINYVANIAGQSVLIDNGEVPTRTRVTPMGTLTEINFEGRNNDPDKQTITIADYKDYIRWQVYDSMQVDNRSTGDKLANTGATVSLYSDTKITEYGHYEGKVAASKGNHWMAFGATMPLMPGAGLEMLEWEINALGVAEGVAALTRLGATVAKKGGAALLEKSLGTAGSEINAGTKIGSAVTTAESGMSAGTHTATVETETVFHTVTDPRAAQGVLDGVNTAKLNPQSRFGKALYISDDASTTLAELSYHNAAPTQTIRYEMDLTKAKILDLTDPTVAKSWGYDGGPISNATKAIGEQAQQAGYNTIKFQSMRGAGTNYAVLSDFEQVLKPQMVVPTPPAPPSTTLPAPDFKK